MKNSPLLTKLNEYQTWRVNFAKTISDYRDWLAKSPQSDDVKELRLYDILKTLDRDQLTIAFLADHARGKTETINALFFSDLKLRLLPSEVGKSSMCSTEILWNADETPSIKLLSIDSRKSEDTLAYLKTTPDVWQTFNLNLDSPDEMKLTLKKLVESADVTQAEAAKLGLWDSGNAAMVETLKKTGIVRIPVWRHAIINYPHPALENGLVIIDTPGLEKLNAEPELMLNTIPSAHAVMFLTATDTGTTASDISIWNEYVESRAKHKFVLLNKIDILWDELKSEQDLTSEIDRQVKLTAENLNISPDTVFPVSAQQALIAKIKNNAELLSKSRFIELEHAIGKQVVQAKHEILGGTFATECSVMIKSSRKIIQQRLSSLKEQVTELRSLRGKNDDESKLILDKVTAEKKRYESSIPTFNMANDKITKHGEKLLKHLSASYLDNSIAQSRKEIGDSWTTMGLNQGMRNVMKQSIELANYVTLESQKIKTLADHVYDVLQSKHGFEIFESPELDMSSFLDNMHALEEITDNFCKNPINVMTEKHFLIRRFFLSLGAQQQKIFEQARRDCERWLLDVLSTLKIQMTEHKATLVERTKNLMKANSSAKSLDNQLAIVEKEFLLLSKESQALDKMLLQMVIAMRPAIKAQAKEKANADVEDALHMPDMPFLTMTDNTTLH